MTFIRANETSGFAPVVAFVLAGAAATKPPCERKWGEHHDYRWNEEHYKASDWEPNFLDDNRHSI